MIVSFHTEVVCFHTSIRRIPSPTTVSLYRKDARRTANSCTRGFCVSTSEIPKIVRLHSITRPSARPPLDLRVHQEIISRDPSFADTRYAMRGDGRTSYIQVCSHETLAFTYKLSISHSALQAARTRVEASKITTSRPVPDSRECERARALQAPAQARRVI